MKPETEFVSSFKTNWKYDIMQLTNQKNCLPLVTATGHEIRGQNLRYKLESILNVKRMEHECLPVKMPQT